MEDAVIQYCLKMIGFDNGEGIFAPGGSIGNMYSLICARYAIKIISFRLALYIGYLLLYASFMLVFQCLKFFFHLF